MLPNRTPAPATRKKAAGRKNNDRMAAPLLMHVDLDARLPAMRIEWPVPFHGCRAARLVGMDYLSETPEKTYDGFP